MSFGFGVGDFIAISKLSWDLYRTCYVIARGAPHEFQLLVHEITTLSQAIKLLEEESQDPESTLCNSGEDRIRMVKEMIARVEETLKELEKVAKRYEKLTKSPGSIKKWWSGVKWALESGDLDGLRNKLVYHNGIISLLLVSCGNSSLQRIEASNARLERSFSQIDGLIRTFRNQVDGSLQNQVVSPLPAISTLSGGAFKATFITAYFMKNAELQNRRWSAIGAEEWIQAGRWWLMKAQGELLANHPAGSLPAKQAYTDLIKASWILLDVIQKHPQLNLIDTGIRGDALVLAEAVTSELELLETLGFAKPSFSEIETCDLTIWEGLTRAPSFHFGHRDGTSGGPYNQIRRWESAEEQVLFQRFCRYQAGSSGTPTPCVILFVAHKRDQAAQIVIRNQSWTTIATCDFTTTELVAEKELIKLNPGDQTLTFSSETDALYTLILWESVREYIFQSHRAKDDHMALSAIAMLFALKRNAADIFVRFMQVIRDQSESNNRDKCLASRLFDAAKSLNGSLPQRPSNPPCKCQGKSLLCWAIRCEYRVVGELLLELKREVASDYELYTSFNLAAGAGALHVIRFLLLQECTNIDRLDANGFSPLHSAVLGHHLEAVRQLLSHGADLGSLSNHPRFNDSTTLKLLTDQDQDGIIELLLRYNTERYRESAAYLRPALLAAIDSERLHILRILIHGRDFECPEARRIFELGLMRCTKTGFVDGVSVLLERGVSVKACVDGQAVLEVASGSGNEPIVKLLLAAGADVNAGPGDHKGRTALQAASDSGSEPIVKLLLAAGADVNAGTARSGRTALQAASSSGNELIVKLLLAAGANVNAGPAWNTGRTALQAASDSGNEPIVKLLLAAGADINARPALDNGRTALQAASGSGHEPMVKLLLAAGADINARPALDNGRTALQAASDSGNEPIVKLLLAAGADVNAGPAMENGRTALQAASDSGNEPIVKLLLAAGADVNAGPATGNGRTALQAASYRGNEPILKLLLAAGADVNAGPATGNGRTALQAASYRGNEPIVKLLLAAGADVDAGPAILGGRTALQAASGSGNEPIVKLLLAAGADVNAGPATFGGWTALQAASGSGHEPMVKLLLAAGADINARPALDNGRTALQAASDSGNEPIVKLLLAAGADVNAGPGDEKGRTALQAASDSGSEPIVKLLLAAGAF